MKVKLLKKVRKRYRIEKIEYSSNGQLKNLDWWLKFNIRIYGYPLYCVYDNNINEYITICEQSMISVLDCLQKHIVCDYRSEFPRKYENKIKIKPW